MRIRDAVAALSMAAIGFCAGHEYTKLGSYAKRYEYGRFAVIVNDMSDEYLSKVSENEKKEMLESQADVLAYCRKTDIPVIAVNNIGQKTTELLMRRILEVPRVFIIQAAKNNAFEDTQLTRILDELETDTVLLMGVYSSLCVFDTAKGALTKGFGVATSDNLMADNVLIESQNDARYGKNSDFHEEKPWYKAHGLYFDDYRDFFRVMK